jgi:asparagine synthase (glutamine-hydrolysing)
MNNSLETRAPLLDHRIIEFSYSLPFEYMLKSGVGKKVLREILYRNVPREIVDRPKMGFSIPLAHWLRNELREWGEEIIQNLPNSDGSFNKYEITSIWNAHQAGVNNADKIWSFLMLASFVKK